ncbi:hypothetical protein E3P77_03618, partial [Wallemia ichthyophaga]
MKLSIFVASAAIASAAAVPIARETQAVPDLLQNLGLTQDQEAVVGQLLKDLGLAPQGSSSSKRETQAVPDLLQNLGLTQDQEAVVGQLLKDLGLAP